MFCDYKSTYQMQDSMNKFFAFAGTNFEEYDEETLSIKIKRVEYLMKSIPKIKNYLISEEYFNSIDELFELVTKVDFLNIDQNDLETFFSYLMNITSGNNSHNLERNEGLFLLLIDLVLSFMCQDECVIFMLFNNGFLDFVKFLLDNCQATRKDDDIYMALAKAVKKSPRIQERFLEKLTIQRFYILATSDVCEIDRLQLIFKILAPLTPPKLSANELTKCLDIYLYALDNRIEQLYPATVIGIFKKIEKNKISQFWNTNYTSIIKKKLIMIHELLIERMSDDEPDPVLCEYTFYISGTLLLNSFRIVIDFPNFQSYLTYQEPLVQVAAAWFFVSLTQKPCILEEQGLDVVRFINDLHLIYQDVSYLSKEHLDRCIFAYLRLDLSSYDKNQLFEILKEGFTDTLVQMIQTKKTEIFELLLFLNDIFEASINENCIEQFSEQFMELGGFNALQELIDDPRYPMTKENEDIPNIAESIIQRFVPKDQN